MPTASRAEIDAFIVMDVMEAASRAEAAGRHIIHMEVGQPSTPAPPAARAAVAQALESQSLGYTVALGLPALREGIAALYRRWYGIELDPARVVVTAGSSGAFVLAFTALFDAGARVGVTEPGYPSYRQILKALDCVPVGMPTRDAARHVLEPVDVPAGLDGIMVASPANPTGTMLDRDQLGALIAQARAAGTAFISDEIYHGLHYGDRAVCALEIDDDAWVINSFSKYFSMTGWRVGWMVVPERDLRTVERLAQNLFICPPHASQVAALAALSDIEELERLREGYAATRALLLERLPRMGLTRFASPDGAFYVYVDTAHLGDDSRALAAEILDRAGVAVTPGLDFDPARGHRTIRLSYARDRAHVAEGLDRLEAFLKARDARA
ncbi:pyridoxal phosphate-dependent aminotransferase [Mangrovicoccus algicola]|uniref:Aminotransferase n=1 Tax=Mangrovicoccus algicola TaxID=2771008 RepID=A0A8J7CVY3_9RHOB|nr:aminotransferase class I/II-fold pyridoxal phosphate-dependent enzyme [Mangrovicoccus algicola]MBE3637047.1 aminotransferase class I/II-fold pyridoxal phosphate-dependent enzyme [Mangrovicoccus algicola]